MSHPHEQAPAADASVRTARPNDAPAVGLVQAFVWQQEYADVLDPEVLEALTGPRFASAWRQSLEHPPSPRHRLLVACAGPQVTGYVAVGPAEEEPALFHLSRRPAFAPATTRVQRPQQASGA